MMMMNTMMSLTLSWNSGHMLAHSASWLCKSLHWNHHYNHPDPDHNDLNVWRKGNHLDQKCLSAAKGPHCDDHLRLKSEQIGKKEEDKAAFFGWQVVGIWIRDGHSKDYWEFKPGNSENIVRAHPSSRPSPPTMLFDQFRTTTTFSPFSGKNQSFISNMLSSTRFTSCWCLSMISWTLNVNSGFVMCTSECQNGKMLWVQYDV